MITLQAPDATERFACFGGSCSVHVMGAGPAGTAAQAAARVSHRMLDWHAQFSRFDPASELSTLNRDPRNAVPVSPMMSLFVEAALSAAASTGGLLDPTLLDEIEAAGYRRDFGADALPVRDALSIAPRRHPAAPSPHGRWREVSVDRHAGTVMRPAGVRLDSGGVAKGLFLDVLAPLLEGHASYALDAAGDVRVGGREAPVRPVQVASPFDGSIVHAFELARGAAATSGITRRSWLDGDGHPAHHLLDPASGRPAFTGVVQVTALSPTGLQAEARAKAALLSGPGGATRWLPHGGLVIYEDGTSEVVDTPGTELR
jgi:thiamine biosynthesis lipoprotein